jgi:hypothetical protein
MENINTTPSVPVAEVTQQTVTPVATKTSERKSLKGSWGKVGAPPKDIKYPRGSFTIGELLPLNPGVCELTLRNRVIDSVRGYKVVKKVVDGKKTETQVSVPVTLVRLDKNATKETVGRPNFRYMSKAAFDANKKNIKKTPKNVTTPSPAVEEPLRVALP